MINLNSKLITTPTLITIANVLSKELDYWNNVPSISVARRDHINAAFDAVCYELRSRDVVLSDHVVCPE